MTAGAVLRAEVRARRRRWLAARSLEALAFAGGVAATTLAAQRLSGPAPLAPAAIAAALCALLAAAVLLRERWRDEAAFARRLDARVGADGALATACEAARRGDADALAELLAARTAARLARERWRGAGAPPSPLYLAALLGGLAVFAAVGAAPEANSPSAALEAPGASASAEELARALAQVDAQLAAEAASPQRRRELQRTREQLAARLESAAGGGAAGESSGAPSGGGEAGPSGAAGAGSDQATLAAGAGDRTMSRPDGPPPMHRTSRTPPSAPAGAAAQRGATWPRRHDAVVSGYLERRPRE